MNDIELRPAYWASVSGGKDSLYMLKYLLNNLDKYPLDGVVHFELDIDYPFIKDVIDYMEKELKKHGISLTRIKPSKSWDKLYKRYGFPSFNYRWCNKEYKLNAEKQLRKFLLSRGERVVYYIGFCSDEFKRFKVELGSRENVRYIYPLAEAGITEDFILDWAKNVPIFNDFYKYNRRCGCMICPMQSLKESAYLLKYYPEIWHNMMDLAEKSEIYYEKKNNKKFSMWCGNPKYNTEYRKNIVINKYLPRLNNEGSKS